jgi:hypothetical protein
MDEAKGTEVPNSEQYDFYQIQMRVGNKSVTGNLSQDLFIPDDPDEIADALRKQPSAAFYYASVSEVAKGELAKLKNEFELWYADRYMEVKRELAGEFGKSYASDTMVKYGVMEHYKEQYTTYINDIARAEYRRNVLTLAAKAFSDKGLACVNLLSWKKTQYMEAGRG